MRHNPLLISQRQNQIINRDTVYLLHGLIVGIMLLDLLFTDNLRGIVPVIISSISVMVIAGFVRLKNIFKINTRPLLYLGFYHAVGLVGFGIFAPTGSWYIFVWLIFIYLSNYFYGTKGALTSWGLLVLTFVAQVVQYKSGENTLSTSISYSIIQLAIISTMSMFFINSESAGDQDRRLLVTSMDKAQLERQRLISLINSMADGVVATDDKGIVKLYNAASLNILDTNQDLMDKDIRNYLKTVNQDGKPIDFVSEVAEKNINQTTTDLLLRYTDDEQINIYLSISPIKLGFRHDAERGFIIAFRDITREKSLEEERNEFISVVSHELRTPIAITEANISNAQFIAGQGNNVGAIKTSLEAAHKQALYLAGMINDLSTLSRAERGKLDMIAEEISPSEIMKSLHDDYLADASTKGLELITAVDDDVPETMTSNRLYVREIMQNFVTNAIKYTKEGSVTIRVSERDGGVEFAVTDTGIGISKSDQKRVFDKFFRSEDFRTRESSGTGLGLYITKKLMKLIGAEIDLKSKLNEGSTFTVYVPNMRQQSSGDDHKEAATS